MGKEKWRASGHLPGEGYGWKSSEPVPMRCVVSSASKLHRADLLASPALQPGHSKSFVLTTSWGHEQRTASMGPGVRLRDPCVDAGFFQLKFWACVQAHSCWWKLGLQAACLACHDRDFLHNCILCGL